MLIDIKQKGFTLLEVIVAVFILTVGIGGSFALLQQTLSGASLVESRLIASYLVQEGIEIARSIRDNNWLEQRESLLEPPQPFWDEGFSGCQGPVACCEGDYNTDTPPLNPSLTVVPGCNFSSLRYLRIDSNGLYSYSAGTQTKFKRKIFVEQAGDDTLEVVVAVEWQEKNKTYSVEAVENMTNWYEQHKD